MSNLIENINIEKEISYENRTIEHFWEKIKTNIACLSSKEENISSIGDAISTAEQIVCIITNKELPSELLQKIQLLYLRGIRVYLLTNNRYDKYSDTVEGKCLIRISPTITGNMILIDPLKVQGGRLYISNDEVFEDAVRCSWFKFIGKAVKEAYHYFCYNFWNLCRLEIKDRSGIKTASESPFDIYPLLEPDCLLYNNNTHNILTDKMCNMIENASSNIIISSGILDNNACIKNMLLSKADCGVKVILIAQMIQENKSVFEQFGNKPFVNLLGVENSSNEYIIIDGKTGILFTSSLTSNNINGEYNQNNFFGVYVDEQWIENNWDEIDIEKAVAWNYHNAKQLEQIKGDEILINIPENTFDGFDTYKVKDYDVINIPPIVVESLRALKNETFDESILNNYGFNVYSKKIKYNISLQPKLRQLNNKEDNLYKYWEQETKRLIEFLNKMEKNIEVLLTKKEKLSNKFTLGLSRFFAGKEQVNKQLLKQIDDFRKSLNEQIIDRNQYEIYVENANNIYSKISKNIIETDEAIDKDEKEQKWIKEREQLQCDINNIEMELEKLENDRDNIENEKEEKKIELEEEWRNLNDKKMEQKGLIQDITKEAEQLGEMIDKSNKVKKLEKEIEKKIKEVSNASKKQKNDKYKKSISVIQEQIKTITGSTEYYNDKLKGIQGEYSNKLNGIKIYIQKNMIQDLISELEDDDKKKFEQLKEISNEVEQLQSKLEVVENDMKVIEQRMKTESNKIEQNIMNKQRELDLKRDKIEELGTGFKYIPEYRNSGDDTLKAVLGKNKKANDKKVDSEPIALFTSNTPNEDLPKVGKLYTGNTGRQLAIEKWSELDMGEAEAIRLNAELVCERRE